MPGPRPFDDDETRQALYAEALDLVEAGWSRADVAARFGVKAGTVSLWCRLRRARVAAELAGFAGGYGDDTGNDPAGGGR